METQPNRSTRTAVATVTTMMALFTKVSGFANNPSFAIIRSPNYSHHCPTNYITKQNKWLFMSSTEDTFTKTDEDDDTVIAFVDTTSEGEKSIDCYIDSTATLNGIEYTIGSPCDYAVALCYFESDDQLVPIELDDALMDDIFPVAEGIIEDEFGEELVLLRTPQTLTLMGELEESGMDEEDGDGEEGMDEVEETEEEVEILVSFEEEGREYHLVRLLDPILLVGKGGNEITRILLTPEESDSVMPKLEEMFLNYQEKRDGM